MAPDRDGWYVRYMRAGEPLTLARQLWQGSGAGIICGVEYSGMHLWSGVGGVRVRGGVLVQARVRVRQPELLIFVIHAVV